MSEEVRKPDDDWNGIGARARARERNDYYYFF